MIRTYPRGSFVEIYNIEMGIVYPWWLEGVSIVLAACWKYSQAACAST